MQHSLIARQRARPVARFVRPPARVRERRLGLSGGTFRPVESSPRASGASLPALALLRAGWRSVEPAPPPVRPAPLRPSPGMSWARNGGGRRHHRPRAILAPWRG